MTERRPLDKERWRRVDAAFQHAVELSEEDRAVFLGELARTDSDLVEEIRSLLAVETGLAGEVVARAADELIQGDGGEQAEADRVAGLQFGPYRAVQRIGQGGMGVIYLGERSGDDFQQRVALKIVRQGLISEDSRRRFRDERRILARLHHEGIARLIDGGVADDGETLWLAMEFIEGQNLMAALAEAPLERRLRSFLEICEAVQYAHRSLIVHRDLKPSNILIDPQGRAKLLDFGIAKVLTEDESVGSSGAPDSRALTPAYASPEQLEGSPITVATDIYTLGVLLFELLAGSHPFDEERRSGEVAGAILGTVPQPPSHVAARSQCGAPVIAAGALVGDLDAICLKALRRSPEDRYATVGDLAEEIRRYLDHRPVVAREGSPLYRARKFSRRHRPQMLLGSLAGATILILTLLYGLRLAEERDLARSESQKASQISSFLVDLFSAGDPSDTEGSQMSARELLDRGAARLDRDLLHQPAMRSELLRVLGDVYTRLGLYDRALELLEQSKEIGEEQGPDHALGRARTLYRIGEVHLFEERFAEAEEALRAALEEQKEGRPPPTGEIADTLDLLGRLERLRTRLEASESFHQEALDLRRDFFGEGTLPVSESLQSFAMLRHYQGRLEESAALLREALDIRRRLLGPEHPETLELQQNLASTLQRLGEAEEALAILGEALGALEASYGAEYQGVGWTLSSMAYSLQQLGRLDEAVDHDRRAAEIFRRRGGGPAGVSVLVQLARHLTQLGNLEEAESRAREALVWLQDSAQEPNPKRSNVLVDLGTILTLDQRYEEAEPVLMETLELDIATYGEDHPYVAQDRYKLGELARLSGRPEAALKWLDIALERQRRLRPGANALGLSLISRGETLLSLERAADAESALREALEVFSVQTPDDHPDRQAALLALGAALIEQDKRAEGEELMEAAIRVLSEKFGEDHARVQEAAGRLASLKTAGL